MKRAGIFLTLMSVMVLVFASVALAAVIKGNDRANYLRGTSDGDGIYGYGGADRIHARGGDDALRLGGGKDKGHGEDGDDLINSVDGARTSSHVALALIGPELTLGTTLQKGVSRLSGRA